MRGFWFGVLVTLLVELGAIVVRHVYQLRRDRVDINFSSKERREMLIKDGFR
jgi:hypothetical protein